MFKSRFLRACAISLSLAVGALQSDVVLAADKGVQATFDDSIDAVKKAAADALTVVGCEIKKNDSNYIEGVRAHKMGAFVGSGGETVSVALTATDGKISVEIHTKKSFVGMAGQKNWDESVLEEMKKTLHSVG